MREELEQCCNERQDCVEMKQHKPDPPREMEMILRPLLLVAIGCHWTPRSFATGSLPAWQEAAGERPVEERHEEKPVGQSCQLAADAGARPSRKAHGTEEGIRVGEPETRGNWSQSMPLAKMRYGGFKPWIFVGGLPRAKRGFRSIFE